MRSEATETALDPTLTFDRSMLALQYAIALLAASAAGLLAFVR